MSTLPIRSGTELCLNFANGVNANHPNTTQGDAWIVNEAAHAVARFVYTVVALPFFATLGAMYNIVGSAAKFIYAIMQVGNDTDTAAAKRCALEALEHFLIAVADLAIAEVSPLVAVAYAIKPDVTSGFVKGTVKLLTDDFHQFALSQLR